LGGHYGSRGGRCGEQRPGTAQQMAAVQLDIDERFKICGGGHMAVVLR